MEEKVLPTEAQIKQGIENFDTAWQQLIDLGCDMRFVIHQEFSESKTIIISVGVYQPVGQDRYRCVKKYGQIFNKN